jgi:hypothetical protein
MTQTTMSTMLHAGATILTLNTDGRLCFSLAGGHP